MDINDVKVDETYNYDHLQGRESFPVKVVKVISNHPYIKETFNVDHMVHAVREDGVDVLVYAEELSER